VIEPYYYDYWGNRVETPEPTRRALLEAMARPASLSSFDSAPYGRCAQDDTNNSLAPSAPQGRAVLSERSESKGQDDILVVRAGDVVPASLADWSVELEDGSAFNGDLAHLPLGYHTVRAPDGAGSRSLIVAPPRCYLPPTMRKGTIWALSTQLYALRSQRNWGIGDFSDLADFVELAASAGARAVGLNPLHALHPHNPTSASPYSPSSRLFLNVLYIDVERVDEFREVPDVEREVARREFASGLAELREADLVDYLAVSAAKFWILEQLYDAFRARHLSRGDSSARAFRRFCRNGGQPLERLAIYEALAEHFQGRDVKNYGWRQWPAPYRDPASPEVTRFANEQRVRVDFFRYLQWLAQRQLAAADRSARETGTALYCDLAVGADLNGADVWSDQDAFATEASLGAPPDPLNTEGQNWGLAPFSPIALRARAYQPFIALLRANMRHAGILRIDHVMALRRAFWIPRGAPASQGAYVRYPMEDLLGIVALESTRNRCAVVGEDLGTVPDGFRERMAEAGALSTRLFYFERDWSNRGFLAPERYPRPAAASIGTHDLPTLAGWWTGDRGEREDRWGDRFLLIDALEHAGAINAAAASRLRKDADRGGTLAVVQALADAVHGFLSKTPCALLVVAIDDVLNEIGAVNVPGTFDEHPNWRRKHSLWIQSIEADGRLSRTGKIFVTR
jgi:4-alpha-glucanotransferase